MKRERYAILTNRVERDRYGMIYMRGYSFKVDKYVYSKDDAIKYVKAMRRKAADEWTSTNYFYIKVNELQLEEEE